MTTDAALVMPFVVVKSAGGPYEDDAFAAGWNLAQIREALSHSGAEWSGTVRRDCLPQLDLIAMERNLSVDVRAAGAGWVSVFIRVPHNAGGGQRDNR